jgi:hypothetical protein
MLKNMAIYDDKLDSFNLYVQRLHEHDWSLSTVTAVVLFCREPPYCTIDVFITHSVNIANDCIQFHSMHFYRSV